MDTHSRHVGIVRLLLQYGITVGIGHINQAIIFDNRHVLEVLLQFGQPAVPLGSEEAPVYWGWDNLSDRCPLCTCLDTPFGLGRRARMAELLLAAGYRPARYRHLSKAAPPGSMGGRVRQRDFCPLTDEQPEGFGGYLMGGIWRDGDNRWVTLVHPGWGGLEGSAGNWGVAPGIGAEFAAC